MGTPMLRAYMHGFFVDTRLYSKAKALSQPFAYEAYRQQRLAAKMEEERQGRISLVRKLPKVRRHCLTCCCCYVMCRPGQQFHCQLPVAGTCLQLLELH